MSILEKLKDWLGFEEARPEEEEEEERKVIPRAKNDIQEAATLSTNIDNTNTMNSIALDTKMENLYMIDNGRAISFDISHPNGLIIATVHGQLMVATDVLRPASPNPHHEPGSPTETGLPEVVEFTIARNAQWNVFFNEFTSVVAIIGVTDITAKMAEPVRGTCDNVLLNIKDRPVNIRRIKDKLHITYINKIG